eukprot:9161844-Alexandrium_andersonii.AAC.1
MTKHQGLTGWHGVNVTPTLKRLFHELGHFAQTALLLERVVAIKAGRGHDYGLLMWWEGPTGPP